MKIGRLLLRTAVGGLFIGHGTQERIGMRPAHRYAAAAGVAETGGGAAIALGLATPLAASALISVMLTAIRRVHLPNGPWITKGGYEYNLVMITALATLAEVGPGELSLDAALGRERTGPRRALVALALGGAGALGVHLAAESQPAPPEPAPTSDGQPAAEPQRVA
jgi:putative oxidoreductase